MEKMLKCLVEEKDFIRKLENIVCGVFYLLDSRQFDFVEQAKSKIIEIEKLLNNELLQMVRFCREINNER